MMIAAFFCAVFLFIYGVLMGLAKREPKGSKKKKVAVGALLRPLWREGSEVIQKRMAGVKAERIELKLAQAGFFQGSPSDFRLIQVTFLVGLPLFYGLLAVGLGASGRNALLLVVIGLAFGAVVPNLYLNTRINKRAKQALKELPDFVDLMTVSLEAGLGFDAALHKVIEKQNGVLAGEFRHCLDEVRLGKTRREGLAGIKRRLNVDEVSTLINSVIRAEKLGVGMVQVLRVQSVEVRDKRKQRAEEQAMKAPIKILFPLVLFVFPSLFIIILGPAAIQIIGTFSGLSF